MFTLNLIWPCFFSTLFHLKVSRTLEHNDKGNLKWDWKTTTKSLKCCLSNVITIQANYMWQARDKTVKNISKHLKSFVWLEVCLFFIASFMLFPVKLTWHWINSVQALHVNFVISLEISEHDWHLVKGEPKIFISANLLCQLPYYQAKSSDRLRDGCYANIIVRNGYRKSSKWNTNCNKR